MRTITVILAAALLTTACAADSTDTTPDTTDEPTTTVTMIDPPDEAGYLSALDARLDSRPLPDDELVTTGLRACELNDGYQSGSRPTPSELLADELEADGLDTDTADDLADAARNAARGTLCDVTLG